MATFIVDPPAVTAEEAADQSKYLLLLQQGAFVQLDQELNRVQQDFESGKIDDVHLLHLFRGFYTDKPSVGRQLDAWIAAYPKSYAAREARGIYYRSVAFTMRGGNYICQTAPQQIADMERLVKLAMDDHNLALTLATDPLLTYTDIIALARLTGDAATAEDMLSKAIQSNPRNFIARFKYMLTLSPRWGGSIDRMKDFRHAAEVAGLPPEQLGYLDAVIADEIMWQQKNAH